MTENVFEYIKILLPRHKCVTLPGLGAFILNKDESNNLDAKSITPPSYSITFNSMLQHDDGTLTSYIQALKGTTYDKASKDLAVAIRTMRAKLLVNKEISCGTLGKIELIDSTIVFVQNKDYISPIHFGLSPIGLHSITTISQGIEKETKTISLRKKLITISASAAVVLLFALPSTSINDSSEKGGNQQAGYLSSLVVNKNANIIDEAESDATTIEEVEARDIIIEDSHNAAMTNNTLPAIAKRKSERTYYLIVGGESSANRAENTLMKFKREGFETAQILESPQRYRIYTQSFDNINDAEIAVAQFRQENPKYTSAWVHSTKN